MVIAALVCTRGFKNALISSVSLFQICKVLGFFFRKRKLQSLYNQVGVSTIKIEPKTSYKSACLRFCAVFSEENLVLLTDCSRCQDVLCAVSCIQDRDEVIIFDFGSKTTWFKYASDSTGQLSMHPTVAPSQPEPLTGEPVTPLDGLDIYQSCPVCSKMFQSRTASLMDVAGSNDRADVMKTERSSSRRLTSAFSRLAMRHFPSCFESADINDDVLSLGDDLQCSSLVSISETARHHDSAVLSTGSNLQVTPDISALATTVQKLAHQLSALPSQSDDEGKPCASSQNINATHNSFSGNSVTTYEFLIQHMLKRNPFFQAQCIPFVLCEPTNCSPEMKTQLLQFLFTQVKVPGYVHGHSNVTCILLL